MSKSFVLVAAMSLMLVSGPAAAAVDAPPGWGVVSGPLVYPAGDLPATLTVCAKKIDDDDTRCTTRHIKAKGGLRYSLPLPPGTYHVYAMTPECVNWKAYYTAFVTCGSSVQCKSHARIPVAVRSGSHQNDVRPADWYDVPDSKKNACDP